MAAVKRTLSREKEEFLPASARRSAAISFCHQLLQRFILSPQASDLVAENALKKGRGLPAFFLTDIKKSCGQGIASIIHHPDKEQPGMGSLFPEHYFPAALWNCP
jgi:hypothetical protein